jgi:hypothetical protein
MKSKPIGRSYGRSGSTRGVPAADPRAPGTAASGDPAAPRMFDHPGSRVSAASPEHLLAMKVLAARRRDAEDIRLLVKHLQLETPDQVLALCAEIFPDEQVPPRARLVLEDVFGDR